MIGRIETALVDAAARLTTAGARTEALAEYVPAGRTLLVPRAERMRRLGSVWRLGVLLLAADVEGPTGSAGSDGSGGRTGNGAPAVPALYATGAITRAHEPGRTTYIAASAERRRQLRVAAHRGRFDPAETVNFDATPIAVDESLVGASGVLTVRDGEAYVRWSPTTPDAATPFAAYLAERVDLLVSPPEGA